MNKLFKYLNYTVTIVLILAAAAIVYVAAPIFSNKALIVRSGSMSPAIKTGDLVVVRSQEEIASPQKAVSIYKAGDVIAFNKSGAIVTHRIEKVVEKNGQIFYETRGDANKSVDKELVSQQETLGKSYLTLPRVGKIVAFAKSNIGFPILVIVPALLVIIFELFALLGEIKKQRSLVQPQKSEPVRLGNLHVLIPAIVALFMVKTTYSFFTDSALSQDNIFSAATIFPGSTGSVVINEINWGGSSLSTADEWIELRNVTGSPIDISGWMVENLGSPDIIIPASSSIPANGFFLISNLNQTGSKIDVAPDFVTTLVSLLNIGEQLRLKNLSAVLIDTANQSSGIWFFGVDSSPGPAKSMERKTSPGDGTVSGNWQTATTSVGLDIGAIESATPKVANSVP